MSNDILTTTDKDQKDQKILKTLINKFGKIVITKSINC